VREDDRPREQRRRAPESQAELPSFITGAPAVAPAAEPVAAAPAAVAEAAKPARAPRARKPAAAKATESAPEAPEAAE